MRQAVVRGGLCSEWASVSTMAAGSPQATNWTVTSPSPLCPLGVLSPSSPLRAVPSLAAEAGSWDTDKQKFLKLLLETT